MNWFRRQIHKTQSHGAFMRRVRTAMTFGGISSFCLLSLLSTSCSSGGGSGLSISTNNGHTHLSLQHGENNGVTSSVSYDALAADNLIGQWNFNENTGTIINDISGNNIHGNVIGTANWSGGRHGAALLYSQNTLVEIPAHPELANPGNNFSLSLWFRLDDISIDGNIRLVSTKNNWDDTDGWELECNPAQSRFRFLASGENWIEATGIQFDRGWHHVVVTHNAAGGRILIDGIDYGDDSKNAAINFHSSIMNIGANAAGNASFVGAIDDLRIYKSIIDDNTINALYNESRGLVAEWTFDDNTGTIATDSSGFNHDINLFATNWTNGIANSAIEFPNDDASASVQTSEHLAVSGQLSCHAWVAVDDPDYDVFTRIISYKNAYTDATGFEFEYNPARNILSFTGGHGLVASVSDLDLDNGFHLLSAVVNGTEANLYVDGIRVGTNLQINPIQPSSGPMQIGRVGGSPFAHFLGSLDEISIFAHELYDEQIHEEFLNHKNTQVGPFYAAQRHFIPGVTRAISNSQHAHEHSFSHNGSAAVGSVSVDSWYGPDRDGIARSQHSIFNSGTNDSQLYYFGLRNLQLQKNSVTDNNNPAALRIAWADQSQAYPFIPLPGSNAIPGLNYPRACVVLDIPIQINNSGQQEYLLDQISLWEVPPYGDINSLPTTYRVAQFTTDFDSLNPLTDLSFKLQVQDDNSGNWMILVDADDDNAFEVFAESNNHRQLINSWAQHVNAGKGSIAAVLTPIADTNDGHFTADLFYAAGARENVDPAALLPVFSPLVPPDINEGDCISEHISWQASPVGGKHYATINWGDGEITDLGLIDNTINFAQNPPQPYDPSQDLNGTAEVLESGNTLHLHGNTWKVVPFNAEITANTILNFDFRAENIGEIHGIGFDDGLTLSANNKFILCGSQNWGNRDFATYQESDGWVNISIPVGNYFTGTPQYLVFISDNDVSNPNNHSWYSNVRFVEQSTDRSLYLNHCYADNGNYAIQINISNEYGYNNNTTINQSVLNVAPIINGPDNATAIINELFELSDLSLFDPGLLDTHIVSVDWGDGTNNNATLNNIPQVNFNDYSIESYGGNGQDKTGTPTISSDGSSLTLNGNSWKKIALNNIITENTILSFDFRSDIAAEVQGIGFDNDNSIGEALTFSLLGNQSWGIRDYYSTQLGQRTRIRIPVGQYFTGSFSHLIFAHDNDANIAGSMSTFSDISIGPGDGKIINGSHSYNSTGTYTITLTAQDNNGASSQHTISISIAASDNN